MYRISDRIKSIANVIFFIGVVGIVAGIILIVIGIGNERYPMLQTMGALSAISGLLLSLLGTPLLDGYGELVENSITMVDLLKNRCPRAVKSFQPFPIHVCPRLAANGRMPARRMTVGFVKSVILSIRRPHGNAKAAERA